MPRPFELRSLPLPEKPRLALPALPRRSKLALAPAAPPPDAPSFFEKLFGVKKEPPGPALAYANPQDTMLDVTRNNRLGLPTPPAATAPSQAPTAGTAVYNIAARTVTLPNGERLEAHFSDATCAGCHASMDGIGFALEKFDWLGRSRETENDREIDTRADFSIGREAISVENATELAHALAGRTDVAACMVRHLGRFALGVRETDGFDCSVKELAAVAQGPEGLRGMIIALVNTPWFVEPAPVQPAEPLEEM